MTIDQQPMTKAFDTTCGSRATSSGNSPSNLAEFSFTLLLIAFVDFEVAVEPEDFALFRGEGIDEVGGEVIAESQSVIIGLGVAEEPVVHIAAFGAFVSVGGVKESAAADDELVG